MIAIGTRDHAATRHRLLSPFGDQKFGKAEWMETEGDGELSPTVFLAEQPPGSIVDAHFHRQNQFQLFVEGSGTIGRHEIRPYMLHYAGAYTGYGPLVAGDEGLKYFTIRSILDTGALTLREAKEKMLKGPKRGGQSDPMDAAAGEELTRMAEAGETMLMGPEADGLAARTVALPPAAAFDLALGGPAHGHFLVVIAGGGTCHDRSIGLWESAFASAEETNCPFVAGETGAQIIVMSMPRKNQTYETQEQALPAE